MRLGPGTVMPGGVSVASSGAGRTYADFQAHIATLATDGSIAWSGNPADGSLTTRFDYRTTMAAETGAMQGTPWQSVFSGPIPGPTFTNAANTSRVVQHCFPDSTSFNAGVSAGREVYFQLQRAGTGGATIPGLNRNGYASADIASDSNCTYRVVSFLYWDGTQAQQMNPFAGTGPTPYTW